MLNFIFNNINDFASDSLMNYLPEGQHANAIVQTNLQPTKQRI